MSAALLTPVLVAGATAFATGLGTKAADRVTASTPPLVSASAQEVEGDCVAGTFLPEQAAQAVLAKAPPADWTTLQQRPDAAFLDTDTVQVSIQGESARTITLTGISFDVARRARPAGEGFFQPCGGPTAGRSILVDLDEDPPHIVASSAEEDGLLGAEQNGRSITRPIRFPWTVSLTDPLLLYVVATTKACYCTWSASIPWVSGTHHGTIQVDDGGRGYRVVSGADLPGYAPYSGRWQGS